MSTDARREATLHAFQSACPRPSLEEIDEWVRRHPDLADDLREHAELLLAAAQAPAPAIPSTALLEGARHAALAAIAAARSREGASDLDALLIAKGATCQGLAREIGIGRAVLVDLVQGRVRLPVPERFARALADALGASVEAIVAAMMASARTPRMGLAKAKGTPAAVARDFADIVRDDPKTSARRKAFWLAPDAED